MLDLFQSTLPRGERRFRWIPSIHMPKISIHAPTRGATYSVDKRSVFTTKFQSTLPRGERLWQEVESMYTIKFQSTLPRGERLRQSLRLDFLALISIHAPTRGATNLHPVSFCKAEYFNPRSHEGSDKIPHAFRIPQSIFQSTLPRGERRPTAFVLLPSA